MPNTNNKVDDPCQECRIKHLKCDDVRPKCKNCEKSGKTPCIRNGANLKFRAGSSAKYHEAFRSDQPWISRADEGFQFINETGELRNFYSTDEAEGFRDVSRYTTATSIDRDSTISGKSEPVSTITSISPSSVHSSIELSRTLSATALPSPASTAEGSKSPRKRPFSDDKDLPSTDRRHDQWQNFYDPVRSSHYALPDQPRRSTNYNGVAAPNDHQKIPLKVQTEYRRLADTEAAAIPAESLLTPEVWKEEFYWPNKYTTTQCACLMRFFIEQLAPWFDVGDPESTFALIVPQLARRHPPLLNAIFTASARHLVALPRYRNSNGVIVYGSIELPDLKKATALHYHQACITYLRHLGNDDKHILDECLLAAAIILRYYEEFDRGLVACKGSRKASELIVFSLFMEAHSKVESPYQDHILGSSTSASSTQWPRAPSTSSAAHSRPNLQAPLRAPTADQVLSELKSFRHACFRVALRQETTACFIRQVHMSTPIPATWSLLRFFDNSAYTDIPDFVHCDRNLLQYARVLQFCYPPPTIGGSPASTVSSPTTIPSSASNTIPTHDSPQRQYQELRAYFDAWGNNKSLSFSPIHYKAACTNTCPSSPGSPTISDRANLKSNSSSPIKPELTKLPPIQVNQNSAAPGSTQLPPIMTKRESVSSSKTTYTLPQYWYMSPLHAQGLSYLELALILLTVYDPTLLRIGPRSNHTGRHVSRKVRDVVSRLCGVAACSPSGSPTSQTALVQAYVALTVCAESFQDAAREEQEALAVVVKELGNGWGWDVRGGRARLEETWGWRLD